MSPKESKDLEKRLLIVTVISSLIFICAHICGCTMSIIVTDTHGEADDVVDSSPKTDAKLDADFEVTKIPGTLKA